MTSIKAFLAAIFLAVIYSADPSLPLLIAALVMHFVAIFTWIAENNERRKNESRKPRES